MRHTSVAAFLAAASLAAGAAYSQEAEPPVPTPASTEDLVQFAGPTTAKAGAYFILSVQLPVPAGERTADDILTAFSAAVPPDTPAPMELLSKKPGEALYLYQQVPKGVYRFKASAQVSVDKAAGFDPHDEDEWTVTVGQPGPDDEDDDTDPEPDPDDDDTDPDDEDAAPFPSTGMAVLITYESSRLNELTAGQRAIIFGGPTRRLLDAKTAMGPDGRTPEYRIWDDETDASAEREVWQKAMAVPRQSDLWLAISNGRGKGFSGPLPADPAAFADILNRLAE